MSILAGSSLPVVIAVFTAAGIVIILAGVRLTTLAERLAVDSGFGQALVGAVLLGAVTSLSGTVTSVTGA